MMIAIINVVTRTAIAGTGTGTGTRDVVGIAMIVRLTTRAIGDAIRTGTAIMASMVTMAFTVTMISMAAIAAMGITADTIGLSWIADTSKA
jgi:hypothetical protein